MPDGTLETLRLDETAPGQYEGDLACAQEGAFAIRITYSDEDGTVHVQEGGAVRGFSGEYDLRIQPDQSLEDLAARTGGRVLSDVADFWATPVSPATSRLALRRRCCGWRLCCWCWTSRCESSHGRRRCPRLSAAVVCVRSSPGRRGLPQNPLPTGTVPKATNAQRQKDAQDTADALLAAKAARKQK